MAWIATNAIAFDPARRARPCRATTARNGWAREGEPSRMLFLSPPLARRLGLVIGWQST
jgi:hypothetical protein